MKMELYLKMLFVGAAINCTTFLYGNPKETEGVVLPPNVEMLTRSENGFLLLRYNMGQRNAFLLCNSHGERVSYFNWKVEGGGYHGRLNNVFLNLEDAETEDEKILFEASCRIAESSKFFNNSYKSDTQQEFTCAHDEVSGENVCSIEFDNETVYAYKDGHCRIHRHLGKISELDTAFEASNIWVSENKKDK